MSVENLMKTAVQSCHMDTNLETAAMLMWNYDCGAIPIVNESGAPAGIITDRDIAMGSAFDCKPLRDIPVHQVLNHRELLTCRADDDIAVALATMQKGQVHRLPVVDADGLLVGMLSMDDLILAAKSKKSKNGAVVVDQLIATLKSVCAPVKHSNRLATIDGAAS